MRRHFIAMASVNLTCTTCTADAPCERCRSITRALRSGGHAVTHSSRYEALRAAALGTYGFDACVLVVAPHEPSIVDAAQALLGSARVGLVVESGALGQPRLPQNFSIIDAAEVARNTFPTAWVEGAHAPPDQNETHSFTAPEAPQADLHSARYRLRAVARRAQRDLAAAGFAGEPRLDLLATLEDEIAWAKMSGACFGLVLVHVSREDDGAPAAVEQLLSDVRQHVEQIIRASDVVAQGSDSIMVVLAEAAAEETLVAAGRIKKAVRKAHKASASEHGSQAARRLALGIAVYPTHGTTRTALLARATASAASL